MLAKNSFNQDSIQISSINGNPFNYLFYAFISNHEYTTLQSKIKVLQHFLRGLDELHNNCENQGILLHWASIGSVFGSAATISGLSLLNPLIGGLVAASTSISAAMIIGNGFMRSAKIKPIMGQLQRYKLAIKSSPINDWAALWQYLGDEELFLDCLYEAHTGIIVNFKLMREDKKNPFAAALDYLSPQLNIDRDKLVCYLRDVKNGATISHETQPNLIQDIPQYRQPSDTIKTQIQPIITPRNTSTFEVINHLSEKIQNSFIVGLPGSGKDFLVSHATRQIKKNNPNTFLFLIDCKNDPKEYGYHEHFDHIERIPEWDCDAYEFVTWFKKVWHTYEDIAKECEQKGHKILVVINEGTRSGQCFSQERDPFIKGKLTAITSSGDSRGRNVWIMVQAPQLEDLGFGDTVRSQLFKVAILHESNVGAIGNWWRTNCFGKQLKPEELINLIGESPRGRIVFSGRTMQWYPMPELENFSGYDRDKGVFFEGYNQHNIKTQLTAKIQDSHVATAELKAVKRDLKDDELRLIQLLDNINPGFDNLINRFAVEQNERHQKIVLDKVREVARISGRLDLLDKFGL